MNTQYLTFILRLRLDDRDAQEPVEDKVYGSLQQAGLQEIHYFDSIEKLHDTLQQLVVWVTLPSQAHEDES